MEVGKFRVGCGLWRNKKTLSDSEMEKIIKKRQGEVLTVYVFKRIVRFFAADEAAVTK